MAVESKPGSGLRLLALGAALLVAACQTNPKQTVLNLDTTDPRWKSRACVQARKAVFEYDDGERLRGVAGLANHAAPYVGTAAVSLLSWRKDPQRARLNDRVRAACVSPPKRVRQQAAARERLAPQPRSRAGRS